MSMQLTPIPASYPLSLGKLNTIGSYIYNVFRVHCFNKRQTEQNKEICNDMEISYYVECDEARTKSSRNITESCLPKSFESTEPTEPTLEIIDSTEPTEPT